MLINLPTLHGYDPPEIERFIRKQLSDVPFAEVTIRIYRQGFKPVITYE